MQQIHRHERSLGRIRSQCSFTKGSDHFWLFLLENWIVLAVVFPFFLPVRICPQDGPDGKYLCHV